MPTSPARRQTVARTRALPHEREVTLMSDLLTITGIGPATKVALEARGIHTKSDLAQMRVEDLQTIRGVSISRAEAIITAAQDLPVDPAEPAVQTEPAPPPAAEARGAPGMQPKQKAPEPAFEPVARGDDKAGFGPDSDAEPDRAGNVVRLKPKVVKGRAKPRLKALKQDKKTAKAKLERAKVKLKAAINALEKAEKAAKKEKKAARKLRSAKKKAKSRRKA